MEGKHRDRTLLQDTDQTAQPRADKARGREKSVGKEESDAGGAESNVGSKYLSPDEDEEKNRDEPEIPDQAGSALRQTTKSQSPGLTWEKQRSHDGISTAEDKSGTKMALSQQEIPLPRRQRRQQLRQQHDKQPEPKKGDKSALKLRLDLNLDIEIELKAKIHGDLTLTLLN
ncbi:hypothetical protein J3F84DRAFT_360624 [Trichoderma pleuroticola]